MRWCLVIIGMLMLPGCGSEPPIPKDKDAIEREIKREKEIRQGLEGTPAKSSDMPK